MIHELVEYPEDKLRSICKEKIEALEYWLRRLIDDALKEAYGDYLNYQDDKGNKPIRGEISKKIKERQQSDPKRYPRAIDAILLDDAISIVCNPNLYKIFDPAFQQAFPDGHKVLRTYLERLIVPRNNLSHANPISIRQAEQVICYAHDIIDSLKAYYLDKGMQNIYNVPQILKVTDSFGSVFYFNKKYETRSGIFFIDETKNYEKWLRPNDTLSLEIEVDPSFDITDYDIVWKHRADNSSLKMGNKIVIPISNKHVGESFTITAKIISKLDWHKYSSYDHRLMISYKVVPFLD